MQHLEHFRTTCNYVGEIDEGDEVYVTSSDMAGNEEPVGVTGGQSYFTGFLIYAM